MLPLVNMQAPPGREISRQQQMMTKVSISILVMALPVLYVSVLRVPPATLFRDTTFWFLMSNSIIVVIAADSGMLFFGSSPSTSPCVDDRPFVVSNYNGDAAAVPPMVSVSSDEPLLPVVVVEDQPLVVARDVLLHGDTAVDSHAHALVVRGEEGVRPKMATSGTPSHAYATGEGDDDGVTVKARLTASRSLAREERAARRRRSRSHSHALVPDTVVVQDKSVVVVRDEKLRRTATEGRRPPTAAEEEESEYYARLSDEELNRRVEDFITRFNREIRLQVEKEELQA
ncbi:hypothetical protein CFC21_069767 [Triticum aestivum]|uniref:DUF4408 domain-containing protein n=2 Tax=Triticum aestivum TaxID=4565 RepID=A0A9R1HEA4_WHEAT|nr:uncharacterized protein LOC123115532 [Triticum aestivum]KAF7063242.1 hypothetical protein CFC21_069767 [Triticum aestivum]